MDLCETKAQKQQLSEGLLKQYLRRSDIRPCPSSKCNVYGFLPSQSCEDELQCTNCGTIDLDQILNGETSQYCHIMLRWSWRSNSSGSSWEALATTSSRQNDVPVAPAISKRMEAVSTWLVQNAKINIAGNASKYGTNIKAASAAHGLPSLCLLPSTWLLSSYRDASYFTTWVTLQSLSCTSFSSSTQTYTLACA